ncbi:MAG: hypothetical protein MJ185_08335 [Treponema sp.]|nr:hypothetical protein [Treponema sp.]
MRQIIQENDIDEEAAYEFLNDCYRGIDLLPNIPETLTPQSAAAILNVSMPTIERMLQEKQLKLTKKSLQQYILDNMLCNRPVVWDDEEKMNAKAKDLSEEEMIEHKKAFSDIEESIIGLTSKDESHLPNLFTEEDLKQE